MNDLPKSTILSIAILLFALGIMADRYIFNKKVAGTQTTSEDTKSHTTITTIKSPNGEIKTVKVIDSVKSKKSEVVLPKQNKYNVAVLAAVDTKDLAKSPAIGISVSKQITDNINTGVFGLNNGILGISIGVNF